MREREVRSDVNVHKLKDKRIIGFCVQRDRLTGIRSTEVELRGVVILLPTAAKRVVGDARGWASGEERGRGARGDFVGSSALEGRLGDRLRCCS